MIALPNIGISLQRPSNFSGLVKEMSLKTLLNEVVIPAGLTTVMPENPSISIMLLEGDGLYKEKTQSSKSISSLVLSLDIENVYTGLQLDKYVTLNLQVEPGTTGQECSYWDEAQSTWKTDGALR